VNQTELSLCGPHMQHTYSLLIDPNPYLVDSLHRILHLVQAPLRREDGHVGVVLVPEHISGQCVAISKKMKNLI
jgi:hypothetical protein